MLALFAVVPLLEPAAATAQVDRPAATDPGEQQVHSVEWLVEQKGSWSAWGAIGRRMIVDGRYSYLTGTKLKLQKCALDFVPKRGETFPRIVSDSKNVEVEGRFATEGEDVVFVVDSLDSRPSDATVVRTKRAALLRSKPEDWYAFADWAEARGDFYGDESLLEEARLARQSGVAAERSALARDDADGLLALADKVERLDFQPRLVAELRHAGWWARWDGLEERDEPATSAELAAFEKQLAEALPGADDKPENPAGVAVLAKSYRSRPLDAYLAAEDDDRRAMHRVFLADVVLRRLLLDATPGNEEQIAERIVALVPEHASRAAELRERALARDVERVPSMTRAEMTSLADRFRKAGDPATARKVTADWLAERERIGREDGADGLVRVADQYESLLADEDKVAALLIEAHALRPDSREIRERLERLGYSWQAGQWTTGRRAPAGGEAIGPTGVTVGMSAAQVTAVLGSPRAVSRVATAEGLDEVWVYGPRSAGGLAVHLVRTRGDVERGRVVRVVDREPR